MSYRSHRVVHGRNVTVRQLRVAQGRVRMYTFLTGEGSAALLKYGQGRTDRTSQSNIQNYTKLQGHSYRISQINCLGIVCQGHKVKVHAKSLRKSLNFQCLKCADINAEEEHKF